MGSHVLYGWAKGAPPMNLPPGVGFRVGQGTGTQVLVLQARRPARRALGRSSPLHPLRRQPASRAQ